MMTNIPRKTLLIIVGLAIAIMIGWFTLLNSVSRSTSTAGRVDVMTGSAPSVGAPMYQVIDNGASDSTGNVFYGTKTSAVVPGMMPIVPPAPVGGQTAAEVDQRIIKTGNLQLVVANVPDGTKRITDVATAHKGFVQSSSFSERGDGSHAGNITVRVPSADFEKVMTEIKAVAALVRNESVNGQDVTEQYTDLQARLHNAQAQEQTYLDILKQAKTVSDTLQVQQQLGQIRGEIESLQGQIKYLSNVTTYSTISVSIEEDATVRAPTKEFRLGAIFNEAGQALVKALQALVVFMIWFVIIAIGLLLPIILIVWLVVWLILRILRKFWKRLM